MSSGLRPISVAYIAMAFAGQPATPPPVVAEPDPIIETVCRGVERRISVLHTYSARVYEKEFVPPHELADYVLTAKTWGSPDSLGFHPEELTDRSLSIHSIWHVPSAWRVESIWAVFNGINAWELNKSPRMRQPSFDYHSITATDGQRLAHWTSRRNTIKLQSYDQRLAGALNLFQTRIIQTGLFQSEYLRMNPPAPQFRVAGRETLPQGECLIIQRKATPATRPDNPNCYSRIWVAPERSFAVLRWEDFSLVSGSEPKDGVSQALKLPGTLKATLNHVYVASDLREVFPGFWVPFKTVDQTRFRAQGGETHSWRIRILEMRDLTVNQSLPALPQLVPLGALVNDWLESRLHPQGWEEEHIQAFLAEPRPDPEQIRSIATLTGDHAPTEP